MLLPRPGCVLLPCSICTFLTCFSRNLYLLVRGSLRTYTAVTAVIHSNSTYVASYRTRCKSHQPWNPRSRLRLPPPWTSGKSGDAGYLGAGLFCSLPFCVVMPPAGYLKATINKVTGVVNILPVTTYTSCRDTCLSAALLFRSACIYVITALTSAQSMEFLLRQRIPWLSRVREKLVLQQSMLCASLLTRWILHSPVAPGEQQDGWKPQMGACSHQPASTKWCTTDGPPLLPFIPSQIPCCITTKRHGIVSEMQKIYMCLHKDTHIPKMSVINSLKHNSCQKNLYYRYFLKCLHSSFVQYFCSYPHWINKKTFYLAYKALTH